MISRNKNKFLLQPASPVCPIVTLTKEALIPPGLMPY
jgi:hypothetical protein